MYAAEATTIIHHDHVLIHSLQTPGSGIPAALAAMMRAARGRDSIAFRAALAHEDAAERWRAHADEISEEPYRTCKNVRDTELDSI